MIWKCCCRISVKSCISISVIEQTTVTSNESTMIDILLLSLIMSILFSWGISSSILSLVVEMMIVMMTVMVERVLNTNCVSYRQYGTLLKDGAVLSTVNMLVKTFDTGGIKNERMIFQGNCLILHILTILLVKRHQYQDMFVMRRVTRKMLKRSFFHILMVKRFYSVKYIVLLLVVQRREKSNVTMGKKSTIGAALQDVLAHFASHALMSQILKL